jgi:hypothetical protein
MSRLWCVWKNQQALMALRVLPYNLAYSLDGRAIRGAG